MTLDARKRDFLCEIGLLKNLNPQQLIEIGAIFKEVVAKPGKLLIHENEISDEVYIILDGEVSIRKKDPLTSYQHTLVTLKKGAIIGELSLLDNAPRSASVRIRKKAHLLVISIKALQEMRDSSDPAKRIIYFNFIENLAKSTARRIRNTNDVVVESLTQELKNAKARAAMGVIVITVTLISALYVLALDLLKEFTATPIEADVILVILSAIIIIVAITQSGYPISLFGLTTKKWHKALREAFLFTAPILLILLAAKWLLIKLAITWYGNTLFVQLDGMTLGTLKEKILSFLIYLLLIPFYELIVRGVLQGSLEKLLVSPYRNALAILTSNLLFGVSYSYFPIKFTAPIYCLGLFLGWLYSRSHTLIGVILAHSMIAAWCFFILNVTLK